MKKQSSGHREDRQDVTTVTPFPGNSRVGSKPHGVHAGGRNKPTELSAGAAESTSQPVQLSNRGSRSATSATGSTKSRTR